MKKCEVHKYEHETKGAHKEGEARSPLKQENVAISFLRPWEIANGRLRKTN